MPKLTAQTVSTLSDSELVEAAVAKWDGPVEGFARDIVGVEPVTLWRWRQGLHRLTKRKRQWFERYLLLGRHTTPSPKRTA